MFFSWKAALILRMKKFLCISVVWEEAGDQSPWHKTSIPLHIGLARWTQHNGWRWWGWKPEKWEVENTNWQMKFFGLIWIFFFSHWLKVFINVPFSQIWKYRLESSWFFNCWQIKHGTLPLVLSRLAAKKISEYQISWHS